MTKEQLKQIYINKYIFAEVHKELKYFIKYPKLYMKIEVDKQFIRIKFTIWGVYDKLIDIYYYDFDTSMEAFYSAVADVKQFCKTYFKY